MSSIPSARVALKCLRTTALATALACTASGAYAGFASVIINDFSVSGGDFFGGIYILTPEGDKYQAWDLRAIQNGVEVTNPPPGTGIVSGWFPPLDKAAQTANVKTTVAGSLFVDALTNLETPGFNLTGTATPPATFGIYEAIGLTQTGGSFCLWDSNIDPDLASCNAAGTLSFSLNYDLLVNALPGAAGSSAYADITIESFGSTFVPAGIVPVLGFYYDQASTILPGSGSKPGRAVTWTANVVPGGSAFFTITGNVVVRAVPEPGVLSLAALGLVGLALSRRRQSPLRSAA